MESCHQNNPPNGNDDDDHGNNDGNNNNNNNHNNNDESRRKKGKGRQKINMRKIENEANRQVTFSKRRGGLFKKSSELSTLCGSDGSVVVFSPSQKAHSFGSPTVDSVTSRFHNQTSLGITRPNESPASQNNPITRQHNRDLTALERQLEEEKRRKRELNQMRLAYQPNLDGFTMEQLNEMREYMLHFQHAFETQVHDHVGDGNNNDEAAEEGPDGDNQDQNNQDQNNQHQNNQDQNNQDQNNQGQQPDYLIDDVFNYNDYMYRGDMHPPGHDGPSNYPTGQFEMGSQSNTNNVFPNPSATFFPDVETTYNPGFIHPLDPSGNNFGYPYPNPNPYPNFNGASSSNYMVPSYNYDYLENFVLDDEDDASDDETSTDEEDEGRYFQDNNAGGN